MNPPIEGDLLWQPSAAQLATSRMRAYADWLTAAGHGPFPDYAAIWRWSVADIGRFWQSIWDYFAVRASVPASVPLADAQMPGAQWFPGARLNYAEQIFRSASAAHPALIFQQENTPPQPMAWAELYRQTALVAAALRQAGVQPGDRVAGYLPNIPQAVVALLAAASLGAIWSSCSPDMGEASVTDRFSQIGPKVLFAVDGYRYGGKPFDRRATLERLRAALPTLELTVLVPYLDLAAAAEGAVSWDALVAAADPPELTFAQLPFDHPLWVLYSSGTTGLPKPIVHPAGGILLEQLKSSALHLEIGPGDRFFWFTTTGWMMWNYLVGGLLVGATIMLYDGSPGYPDLGALWRFAAEERAAVFGTSAAFIQASIKADVRPADHDLSALRCLGSTGSPLPVEGFQWAYSQIKPDLWLVSTSGGTDVCTAFVGGTLLLPVHAGEIQCRCLGCDVQAWDEAGQALIDAVGELVLAQPIPSMPVFFWNDPGDVRLRESYFDTYPHIWRHGDWVKVTARGSLVIYGRSDSTINRQGVRMGTAEIYRVVEGVPQIADSLVVDLEGLGGRSYMPLFVVLQPGAALDAALEAEIKRQIRTALSPRHVPDAIIAISAVPRTLNGKKLEVPVKKILLGQPIAKAANPDAMSNPHSLAFFVEFAETLAEPLAEPQNPRTSEPLAEPQNP